MTCSSCEERRKLLTEAAVALREGDADLVREKVQEVAASFFTSARAVIQRPMIKPGENYLRKQKP